tara:strand:+ start:63608 stop:64441 length:834 start_codon:yes stop_codon:yes gene_type:complete
MKTNKLDKNIKEKFDNRAFEPSASAWERLSVQLDEQPKQKKFGWFFYIGVAASILLLVSIGLQVFSDTSKGHIPIEEIVISPVDKNEIDTKIDKLINEIPASDAIVKNEEIEVKKEIIHPLVSAKNQNVSFKKKGTKRTDINLTNIKSETIITKVDDFKTTIILKEIEGFKSEYLSKKMIEKDPNRTIKINADDLLYAVTHSNKEVKEYYVKYNINREDVLKTIKDELKKSNLKVNPNTILAEVERNINDDFFENNFMKSLKRKVSDIATVIASRND